MTEILKIATETKRAIERKTAMYLPDRPSDMGMKPNDIKKAFYTAITESSESAIAEIDRVIDDINTALCKPLDSHVVNETNPHSVTKSQIGLSECNNTSDLSKPISTLQLAKFVEIEKKFDANIEELKKTLKNDYRLISDSYTKGETDTNFVGTIKYSDEQLVQDNQTFNLKNSIGNVTDLSGIVQNNTSVVSAILSLNEDIDNLQLGVEPRIMRGVVLYAEPDKLDAELIAAMNSEVKKATDRDQPNNSDSIQVWDNAMPDAGRVYTYNFWYSPGSNINGWYLGSIYTSPAITEIPSYVYNIINSSWTSAADENGLYYLVVPPDMHGMGNDMTLYVDLRRQISETEYESISLFNIQANGTVTCYTDEKFNGKLIIRVGKAYYTTNTTEIVTIEPEQVNGLDKLLGEKYCASNPPPYPVASVSGKTGTVSLTKTDVGLGNIDNVRQYSASNLPPYPVVANGTYPLMTVGKSKIAEYASADESKGTIDWRFSQVKTDARVFDKVIRTQAEFEELISSETWLGAKSVMFVGDGGTLQFSATAAIVIPATVKDIEGINSATIKNTGSSAYEMCFGYEQLPQSDDYSIENLKIVSECNYGAAAFMNCINLINCIAENLFPPTLQVANSASGFCYCKNLLNCASNVYTNNSNKQGDFVCSSFYHCTDLINCKGQVNADDSHSCITFSYCKGLTNCKGYAKSATNSGYTFCNITNATNCRQLEGTTSTTATWGYTNKNIDIATCRRTAIQITADELNELNS